MSPNRAPNVAVLIDLSLQGGRYFVQGLAGWVHDNGPWRIILQEGRMGEQDIDLDRSSIDGIIASCVYVPRIKSLMRRGVPTVLIDPFPVGFRPRASNRPCATVKLDSYSVGVLAANYYLDRRYHNFAYVNDTADSSWSYERQKGFANTLAKAGYRCDIYARQVKNECTDWLKARQHMIEWLNSLRKPVAIFAAMDGRARLVLDACAEANIRVPEEVSVLGVDNDIALCESAYPSLSSINIGRSGETAARILSELMEGKSVAKSHVDTNPISVVTRESTGHDAMRIPVLAQALKYIFHTAPETNISASNVLNQLKCSRRLVETAFRQHLNRSIMDEIRRVKFEHVKDLLETTSLSIHEIADKCGFPTDSQMAFRFRQLFGFTMSEWRKNHNSKFAV